MVKFPIKVSYTKNEQICVIYIIFLFIFKTLIVMSLHEAFLVWPDHCKSWMSNVSLGFALANIAHPRESFMQCTNAKELSENDKFPGLEDAWKSK